MKNINIGGQAVIEGVMMRSAAAVATAVRCPNGEIIVETASTSVNATNKLTKIPMVRGIVSLFDSLKIGISSLHFSAVIALPADLSTEKSKEVTTLAMAAAVVLGLGFGVALLVLLPLFITRLFIPFIGSSGLAFSAVDGVIRVVVFISYIAIVGRIPKIQRVFQYHGAEHKAIHGYESGEELTVENVKRHSRLHPRCGTSFVLIVMFVCVVVFSLIPHSWPILAKLAGRLVLMPLVAGVSYELLKLGAVHATNPLAKLVSGPGLALQKLTTREPDDQQIEVAIMATVGVIKLNPEGV